jgi:putative intracellular protease/amidase
MTTGSGQQRALLCITSHDRLGDTGQPSGYTVMEAADPWAVFTRAGLEVEFATVSGGRPPEDGFDRAPMPNVPAFRADTDVQAKLDSAPAAQDVDPDLFDIVLFVGGHGAMWDFPNNRCLERLGAAVFERGGVVAAVCHGLAALVDLRLSDGSLLIAGKEITGFSDAEERVIHRDAIVPFLLQSRLEELGARYTSAGFMAPHVVVEGRLVTGQNPVSAYGVAQAALAALTTATTTSA